MSEEKAKTKAELEERAKITQQLEEEKKQLEEKTTNLEGDLLVSREGREGGRKGGREGFSKLQSLLGLPNKAAKDLMSRTCGQAIKGSYRIWCMRNLSEPP